MEFIMYAISYIEINTCCMIILLLILHRHLRGLDKSLAANTFLSFSYAECELGRRWVNDKRKR